MTQYFTDSLNEHTSGGFIYVRINEEGGVEIYQKFDNEICHLAAWTKVKQYIALRDRIDEEIGIENILAEINFSPEDGEEGMEDGDDEDGNSEKWKDDE